MADQPGKRWIVLLNKVPRGPLTADQIRALIKEGLLRHNDIAFQAPEPGADPETKKNSEWKLLWQFSEFDRRLEKDGTSKPEKPQWSGTSTPPPEAAGAERRRQITPAEATEKTRDQLPTELLDIPPEDLLVHSTSQEALELTDAPPEAPRNFDLNLPSTRALVAGALTVAVMLFAWIYWPARPSPLGPKPIEPMAAVDSAPPPPLGGKAPTARIKSRPATTSTLRPTLPEARIPASGGRIDDLPPAERGEIAPPDEDDERARLEESGGSDDEPAPTGKIRRPRGNKRSRVLTDDRGEPDEDEPASARDEEPPSND